jgi:uncharacterized protein (DUF4415 family)
MSFPFVEAQLIPAEEAHSAAGEKRHEELAIDHGTSKPVQLSVNMKTPKTLVPPEKHPVTFRMDTDVLLWFKAQGRRYQTLINAVLREYMHTMRMKKT